jgi:hypothetical protein
VTPRRSSSGIAVASGPSSGGKDRLPVRSRLRQRLVRQREYVPSRPPLGKLRRLELRGDIEEPLVLVEVENATVEPDGTRKHYLLRVPPHMRTARDAVA